MTLSTNGENHHDQSEQTRPIRSQSSWRWNYFPESPTGPPCPPSRAERIRRGPDGISRSPLSEQPPSPCPKGSVGKNGQIDDGDWLCRC